MATDVFVNTYLQLKRSQFMLLLGILGDSYVYEFVKSAGARLVGAGATLQVLAWFCGLYDELTALIKSRPDLTLIGVVVYLGLYGILYDAEKRTQQLKYKNQLKGASIRNLAERANPMNSQSRQRNRKSKDG